MTLPIRLQNWTRATGRSRATIRSIEGNFEHFAPNTDADNNGTVPLRFNSEAGMVAGAGGF